MKKLILILALAGVTTGAMAADVAGVIDGGAYDAAVTQANDGSEDLRLLHGATDTAQSYLAGRFIVTDLPVIHGEHADVMARVEGTVCKVQLKRNHTPNQREWLVQEVDCK
jgi:hypothetical protein